MAQQQQPSPGFVTGFSAAGLLDLVARETHKAYKKVDSLQTSGDSISIKEMFEMQMTMNKLSQCSEMATSVVSSANQAIISVTRGIKQ